MDVSANSVYILCIETANAVTSVAISANGKCVALKEVTEPNKAADKLHLLVNELLDAANLTFSELNAVAISAGPGSYTGLRIAAAAAKGYCMALDIPLVAASTLEAMVEGIKNRCQLTDYDVFIPMIDARRMEVFTAFIDKQGKTIQSFISLIIDKGFTKLLDTGKKHILFGNGAAKVLPMIDVDTIVVHNEFIPSAEDLCAISFLRFSSGNFEDIAYFEPNYSKAFHSTASNL